MDVRDQFRQLATNVQSIINGLPPGSVVTKAVRSKARSTLRDAAKLYRSVRNETNARLAYMISECQAAMDYGEFITLLTAAKWLQLDLAKGALDK